MPSDQKGSGREKPADVIVLSFQVNRPVIGRFRRPRLDWRDGPASREDPDGWASRFPREKPSVRLFRFNERGKRSPKRYRHRDGTREPPNPGGPGRPRGSRKRWVWTGAPYGIRTRVLAVRGPRPRPLDEGSKRQAVLIIHGSVISTNPGNARGPAAPSSGLATRHPRQNAGHERMHRHFLETRRRAGNPSPPETLVCALPVLP